MSRASRSHAACTAIAASVISVSIQRDRAHSSLDPAQVTRIVCSDDTTHAGPLHRCIVASSCMSGDSVRGCMVVAIESNAAAAAANETFNAANDTTLLLLISHSQHTYHNDTRHDSTLDSCTHSAHTRHNSTLAAAIRIASHLAAATLSHHHTQHSLDTSHISHYSASTCHLQRPLYHPPLHPHPPL